MKDTTVNSLNLVCQHFNRASRIISGIDRRRYGDPKKPDAREIGQIAKLYAHLKEGSSRLDQFLNSDEACEIVEDSTIDMLYEINGNIKVTLTFITEIFMKRLAIDDLPPGITRRHETYGSDKENILKIEGKVCSAISLTRSVVEHYT